MLKRFGSNRHTLGDLVEQRLRIPQEQASKSGVIDDSVGEARRVDLLGIARDLDEASISADEILRFAQNDTFTLVLLAA